MEALKKLFEWLWERLYVYYPVWLLFALVCCVGVFEDTNSWKDPKNSVTQIPFMMIVLVFVAFMTLGFTGRRWERPLRHAHHWAVKSSLQAFGLCFSNVVNGVVTTYGVGGKAMLSFCGYALCLSQYFRLGVKMEMSMVWLSTAFSLVWSQKPATHLWKNSAVVLAILLLGNFLDSYVPRNREVALRGRAAAWGSDKDPDLGYLGERCPHCGSSRSKPKEEDKGPSAPEPDTVIQAQQPNPTKRNKSRSKR